MNEKKRIKLAFIGFELMPFEKEAWINLIRTKFDIVIDQKDPDFVIVTPQGDRFEYLQYKCPRIFWTAEPMLPNFALFDYIIGFDDILFPDANGVNRYFQLPYALFVIFAQGFFQKPPLSQIPNKSRFCSYVYGHHSANGEREAIFKEMEKIDRVDSAGTYLNNMPNHVYCNRGDMNQKLDLLGACEFDIACESVPYPGFLTEKIVHCFMKGTIPIYVGDPHVTKWFNEKSFIRISGMEDIGQAMLRIRDLHDNDERRKQMLSEPMFADDFDPIKYQRMFEDWLFAILSQERKSAFRRVRAFEPVFYERELIELNSFYKKMAKSPWFRLRRKIARVLRK